MCFIFLLGVEVLKEVAAQQARERHREVHRHGSQSEESTLASRLGEVEGKHIYHWCVERLCKCYDYYEDHKVHDVHSEEHGNGTGGLDRRTQKNQVIWVVVVLDCLDTKQENDDQDGRNGHVDSKWCVLSVVLYYDFWKHEKE